ncbi:SDR family NAD(P)-dependent oxidoreductase [Mesobacterium pallidum]|uniref:SDR family NAD(P)-dependent oxidoreductase n=1 Tax=Mesobacterium pallidum TaxID=2872037 RepID=UPI001EE2950A|nr:SDR family NAD(P)-dependent oxidoreductase [Mesobacterium pallidum]
MKRLEGRPAIVTGAGSGIGRASAIRLASEGARVLLVGRTEATLAETRDIITAAGDVAELFVADAADETQMRAAVDRCIALYGGLKIFFANAGNTDSVKPFLEQTVEAWEGMYRDNVITAFIACKLAGGHMIENGGGSIILNSSTGSLRARGGTEAYGAAKAAVNNLTQTAACAFAGRNTRVNAILPGLTETGLTKPMFDWARDKGKEGRMGKLTPMQRPGYVADMAGVVAFLASDDSAYVDGQLLPVDGGISCTHPAGRFVY